MQPRYNEMCKPRHHMRIGFYHPYSKYSLENMVYRNRTKAHLRKDFAELMVPFLQKFNYKPTWIFKDESEQLNNTTGKFNGLHGLVI